MKIVKFRIKNFRSIIDSDWRSFSPDGVTVLVGQNESGKSAILDALSVSFSTFHITDDDIRYGCELPEISFQVEFDLSDLIEDLEGYAHPGDIEKIRGHFLRVEPRTQVVFKWHPKAKHTDDFFICKNFVNEPELETPAQAFLGSDGEDTISQGTTLAEVVAAGIFSLSPTFTLFQSNSGLLPNWINIDENYKLVGDGKKAAENLLSVTNIDLESLIKLDRRSRESKITRAENDLNKDLNEFWNQKVGSTNKIKIEFTLEHHDNSNKELAGVPFLMFWVSDGLHKLHPKQRSAGVRWFLSFYLQLKASQKSSDRLHFLLDEPGANLHSNAQKDVLKLINLLSKEISITYSTHSPSLIEHDKLYRVYAIQRKNDDPETPTEIIDAHQLGAASSDTLSPILTAIGTDFSHQNVIQKNNNIILEEASGFYYLNAFWKLLNIDTKVNFIAATGANKIPALANMFTGWGLNFSVVLDDENQGRAVYNKLKKDLWGDNEDLAKSKVYKIKNCKGIEDIFTHNDFFKFVLNEEIPEQVKEPSETVKSSQYSKPVLAYKFALKVTDKAIALEEFEPETAAKIKDVTSKIISLLH